MNLRNEWHRVVKWVAAHDTEDDASPWHRPIFSPKLLFLIFVWPKEDFCGVLMLFLVEIDQVTQPGLCILF